jgi:transcriptional regulator with XRE-family HTH domain
MESQHMTQQLFADYIGLAPATLSSIFNGRTRPTLNVVEALKKKFPNINIDWLMFGSGEMFQDSLEKSTSDQTPSENGNSNQSLMLDFDQNPSPTAPNMGQMAQNPALVKNSRLEPIREEVKILDKPQRRVIEIRVFYDDQTWDTFVPVKK